VEGCTTYMGDDHQRHHAQVSARTCACACYEDVVCGFHELEHEHVHVAALPPYCICHAFYGGSFAST
jgi:hypothetical protein